MEDAKTETKEFLNHFIKAFQMIHMDLEPENYKEKIREIERTHTFRGGQKHLEMDIKHMETCPMDHVVSHVHHKQKVQNDTDTIKAVLAVKFQDYVNKQKQNLLNDSKSRFYKLGKKKGIFHIFQQKKKQLESESDVISKKIFKRGDIIRRKEINYSKPCIQKFRRIVERNFFKVKKLEYFEQMEERKANVNLITNLYIMKNALETMFPEAIYSNIGQKIDNMEQKNIYINPFFYNILDQAKSQQDRWMIQYYLDLKSMPSIPSMDRRVSKREPEICSGVHLSNASEGLNKIDNLFNSQTDKNKFYTLLKKMTLGIDEYRDLEKNAMLDYYDIQNKK